MLREQLAFDRRKRGKMGLSPQFKSEVGETVQEDEGSDKFIEITDHRQVVRNNLHDVCADVGEINS